MRHRWGVSFWEGLRSWVALLVEWRIAGAVLTEDKGLASTSKKDQEDAVLRPFSVRKRPQEVRPR